jgi:hypothetical protein
MPNTLSVSDAILKDYQLSVTTRDKGDDATVLEELTFRTIGAWLFIVNRLEQQVFTFPEDLNGSVEARYETEKNIKLPDAWGDARVTVWSTYRGQKNPQFHLNSDDVPLVAINTWLANQNAIKRAVEKYGTPQPKPSNVLQDTPPASAQAPTGSQAPAMPKNAPNAQPAVEGAIVATRAPNPNEKTYQDGQLVEFKINKIVLGTHPNSGSVIYSLWGDLGKKYALQTVYVMDSNGTDKSRNYKAVESVLEPLGLSIPGKMTAEGNWRLICKAANSGEKQYLNIISLSGVV